MYDASNEPFKLAADVIMNTSRSAFLSGNAGTGKTTFLKFIQANADKRLIVAAPTGIAAINAGGVTLHSLFQLPFEPYTPNYEGHKILNHHVRFHRSKINLLRELELLIIDEVSMLRADMLDAIDAILRRFRNTPLPFGGVQMLFIGDLYQLPPVLQEQDEERLKPYYESPFFFHAHAMNGYELVHIHLKKIYRQEEEVFINLLNRIRINQATSADLAILNKQFTHDSLAQHPQHIVLSTHNYKVDRINKEELARLKEKEYLFVGKQTGDFSEHALPTDKELYLKQGARVMFTKNDTSEKQAYYNGKTGVVESLSNDLIMVRCHDGSYVRVAPESWKNIRYSLNADTGEIKEEEIGTYTQYPLRLAWAITVHKSQGLTFDHVIVDVQQAFAAGQVYVALSRCRSLDGLLLSSPITPSCIESNPLVSAFSTQETSIEDILDILSKEKTAYCADRMKQVFNWLPIIHSLNGWIELIQEKEFPQKGETLLLAETLRELAIQQEDVARKFRQEIGKITSSPNFLSKEGLAYLKERTQKAVIYFHKEINDNILSPLNRHILLTERKPRVKQYIRKAKGYRDNISTFLNKMETIRFGNLKLTQELDLQASEEKDISIEETPKKAQKAKTERGASARITLELFRTGLDIGGIAQERSMAVSTIESHLEKAIIAGEVTATELIQADRYMQLHKKLQKVPLNQPLSTIKQAATEFSYGELRFYMADKRRKDKKHV